MFVPSQPRCAVFWPAIREIACLTRSRSAVNGVAGAPSADAGDGDAIGRRQPIDERVGGPGDRHRAAEADVRLVDAITISRPPVEFSFEL